MVAVSASEWDVSAPGWRGDGRCRQSPALVIGRSPPRIVILGLEPLGPMPECSSWVRQLAFCTAAHASMLRHGSQGLRLRCASAPPWDDEERGDVSASGWRRTYVWVCEYRKQRRSPFAGRHRLNWRSVAKLGKPAEKLQGLRVRQRLLVLHRPAMDDIADGQFRDLSRLRARYVGHRDDFRGHMPGAGS